MRTKTIDRISILELCKTADVNRNTFYAHYSTPEDVLNEIENELVEESGNS
jgi:AcrR family transcriptional regulator